MMMELSFQLKPISLLRISSAPTSTDICLNGSYIYSIKQKIILVALA